MPPQLVEPINIRALNLEPEFSKEFEGAAGVEDRGVGDVVTAIDRATVEIRYWAQTELDRGLQLGAQQEGAADSLARSGDLRDTHPWPEISQWIEDTGRRMTFGLSIYDPDALERETTESAQQLANEVKETDVPADPAPVLDEFDRRIDRLEFRVSSAEAALSRLAGRPVAPLPPREEPEAPPPGVPPPPPPPPGGAGPPPPPPPPSSPPDRDRGRRRKPRKPKPKPKPRPRAPRPPARRNRSARLKRVLRGLYGAR